MLKKTHRSILAVLAEKHAEEIERLQGLYKMADRESRNWRARFELLQLSPEIKADTENAFKRGEGQARRKLANQLMMLASELSQGDTYEAT